MKLLITTQVRENYGSIKNPHWKSKGVNHYVVKNVDECDMIEVMLYRLRDQIETDNPFFSELVIGYNLEVDDYLTRDEQLQLEFDGKITYPTKELFIEGITV